MNLFKEFGKVMPTNEELIQEVLKEQLGEKITPEIIKANFSSLVETIHNDIYKKYFPRLKFKIL